MPEMRDAFAIVIGTLYGPPPTRNGVAGGVMSTCAWPIPVVGGCTSVAAGLGGVGLGVGTATGGGTAAAPGGGGGGCGSGGAGVTTNPGTGDVPGGTCMIGGEGGGGCGTTTPG